MAQYYVIVNVTKKEFLTPNAFGDGQKFMEFAFGGFGVMAGLAILLNNSNYRSGRGGDVWGMPENSLEYFGRWAGDQIVVAGDYAEGCDNGEEMNSDTSHHNDEDRTSSNPSPRWNLFTKTKKDPSWCNISGEVAKMVAIVANEKF